MSRTSAVICAAGKGSRMGSVIPKQYMMAGKMPVLGLTVQAFEKSSVDEIIIVCPAGDEDYVRSHITEPYGFTKVKTVTAGGSERYHSVYNGLQKADCDIVLIHDGARPYIKPEVIDEMTAVCESCGAVIAGMPVKDTIKIADPEGFVASTTDRALTWQIQTPQCFVYSQIMEAYEKILPFADRMMITDDAMVYEAAFPDKKIKLYKAGYENIKITTPDDLR